MLEAALSLLILLGALFVFVGSLGLARLPDFYTRLHGPTKATTLGVGSLLIASALYFSTRGGGLSLHEVLVTLFLFITAPVSAHLLSKAALHLRLRSLARPPPLVAAADGGGAPDSRPPTGRRRPTRGAAEPTPWAAGRRQGEADLLLFLLERRFGPLPTPRRAAVEAADAPTLRRWAERLFDAERIEVLFDDCD